MVRWYIAIDLKSFYASVECVARGLDPLATHLVVADGARTNKTICLAVTPALKAEGVGGRPRLFEVEQAVEKINAWRRTLAGAPLEGASSDAPTLAAHPEMALDYIVARPRMALYMKMSATIYSIYLRYIAPEDIYAYSVDEVFIDATPYLRTYRTDAEGLARMLMQAVFEATGITATAGVGTNLYLAKVAMDIRAKHMAPDARGARLAVLDEARYRRELWAHEPITDFWRVGRGTAKRLAKMGIRTMGDVARCSLGGDGDYYNEELLYKAFGVNAELLIDHAWGWEPCTLADIKSYVPENNSLSSGQVLHEPYTAVKARRVLLEMAEAMSLDLLKKGLVCDQITLTVGYDIENLNPARGEKMYRGEVHIDHYGRQVPKHAHGTANFAKMTSSSERFLERFGALFDEIVDADLLIRRLTLGANHVVGEAQAARARQQSLFDATPPEEAEKEQKARRRQEAVLAIKERFGKNAILRATSLEEGATAIDRNNQIGGHRA
ncbi:MAG: DNA methylase [Peptococcaceae bacterium]|nr:DNA methylase [Peptococcaceae bacterium]